MRSVAKTRNELLAILDDMHAVVAADDSLEGFIEYGIPSPVPCGRCGGSGTIDTYPGGGFALNPGNRPSGSRRCTACDGSGMCEDPDLKDAEFVVRASYRVGNSMGQGGVRMVGEV